MPFSAPIPIPIPTSAAQPTNSHSHIRIRPTAPSDAQAIARIQNYYITHSIKTIYYSEHAVQAVEARIRAALDEGYLSFVAVAAADTAAPAGDAVGDDDTGASGEKVLGYVSTSRFRPQDGWAPSAEVSLFLATESRGRGSGGMLLRALIERVRVARGQMAAMVDVPGYETPGVQGEQRSPGAEFVQVRNDVRDIRQLVAVCVVDEDDLEGFYKRFGFVRVAFFEKGGFKFGKWIDIVMMQLTI